MSQEAARAFYEKIKSDPALAKQIVGLGDAPTDDDMIRVAKQAGFECTADELDQVGLEAASELDEAQLDGVAGGTGATAPKAPTGAYLEKSGPGGDVSLKIQPGTKNLLLTAYKVSP